MYVTNSADCANRGFRSLGLTATTMLPQTLLYNYSIFMEAMIRIDELFS